MTPFRLQVKQHYSDVPIYVMANGVQEDPARFKDSLRVYYLYNYINEALKGEAPPTRRHDNRRYSPEGTASTLRISVGSIFFNIVNVKQQKLLLDMFRLIRNFW